MFVVVTFVAVLYNAVLRSPLIFLRLAESSVGEMDMLVTPYVPHFDPLLDLDAQEQVVPKFEFFNATALDLELEPLSAVSGSAPRWVLQGKAASQRDPQTAIATSIVICDLEREAALGIGRGWPHRLLSQVEPRRAAAREPGAQGTSRRCAFTRTSYWMDLTRVCVFCTFFSLCHVLCLDAFNLRKRGFCPSCGK